MTRLRLAVVGVGHLGRIHARLAAGIPEIELRAVVDARQDARDAVAAETGARALADFRELFGEVDAAVVATPTSTHLAVASELMRGGIHVLVEKPLAPTAAEAEQLVQLARRRQLVIQTGHVERFNPAFTSVQSLMADAKFIEARRQSGFTFRSTDVGVVMDLMIHDIDAALALVRSPVASVDAVGVSVLGDNEDMASARIKFANGAVACLTASRTSYIPERTMRVFTPSCFAAIDFASRKATAVEPRVDVLQRKFRVSALSEPERNSYRDRLFEELLIKREVVGTEVNAIAEEQKDFAAAIAEGRSPRVTGADGRDAVAIAERILEQIAAHQWDGVQEGRVGAEFLPLASERVALEPFSGWSDDDTVILRRKAS